MTIINKRRSYSGLAFFYLLFSLCEIILSLLIIFSSRGYVISDIPKIILIFILLNIPAFFFIDIFLWHFLGKEIIIIKEKELVIVKAGRLLRRKRRIKPFQVKDIYFWQKNISYIHKSFAFWDLKWQGALCIKYNKCRKYYMGVNMNKREADELLETLIENIPYLRQIKEGEKM